MKKSGEARTETCGKVLICHLLGKMDGITTPDIASQINALIDRGMEQVVFDLEKLEYISSIGFRFLLLTEIKLKKVSGSMIVCSIPDTVRHFLKISGTLELLHTTDSVRDALECFTQPKLPKDT